MERIRFSWDGWDLIMEIKNRKKNDETYMSINVNCGRFFRVNDYKSIECDVIYID